MHRLLSDIHTLVQREGAEQYLLYSLLSFALSVSLTRLFLELTGYPQLGNSELHVAHVLWGGLLLFIAALLPLLVANRWVYSAGAILSGLGVGLFIDEVGKFITQSNDYFYPAAAPIIYAFFLLVVLLYVRIRRPPSRDPRAELYRAFDALQEVLDHDLDPEERADLIARLHGIMADDPHPNHIALARALLDFVHSEELELAAPRATPGQRLYHWTTRGAERWIGRRLLRTLLAAGLLLGGLGALAELTILLPREPGLAASVAALLTTGDPPSDNLIFLYTMRVGLEGLVGIILLLSGLLFLLGRERRGLSLAYLGLLVSLTVVDLLVFYFDQFSTILLAIYQLALLIGSLYYRQRFSQQLDGEVSHLPEPE